MFLSCAKIGAGAWIITTLDQKEWIEGGAVFPGPNQSQFPYRSELGGLLEITVYV